MTLNEIPDLEQILHLRKEDHKLWTEKNARIAVNYVMEKIGLYKNTPKKEKIEIIKKRISQQFLVNTGLEGVMTSKGNYYLEKMNSPQAVLKFYNPSLFDLNEKYHLHEWDLGTKGYWNDEKNAQKAINHVLEDIRITKGTPRKEKIKIIKKKIMAYNKGTTRKKDNSKNFFYDAGLEGMMTHKRAYLEKMGSPYAVLKFYDPSLFDLTEKEHIHEWENGFCPHGYWDDKKNARKALDHIFEEIGITKGTPRKEKIKIIQREIIRPNKGAERNGYMRFFYDTGLDVMVVDKRTYLEKQASPQAVLKFYDPSLFDLTEKEHIHEWDFSPNGYWNDEKNARKALDHALEEIGITKDSSRKEKIKRIIEKMVRHEKGALQFFYDAGLTGMIGNKRTYLRKTSSPQAVLKFYDPSLFDLTEKEHIHEWELGSKDYYWNDKKNARKALDHIFEEIGITKTTPKKKIADIIGEKVIGYEKGALQFFYDAGLDWMIKHKRDYLEKTISTQAILKFYFEKDKEIFKEIEQELNRNKFPYSFNEKDIVYFDSRPERVTGILLNKYYNYQPVEGKNLHVRTNGSALNSIDFLVRNQLIEYHPLGIDDYKKGLTLKQAGEKKKQHITNPIYQKCGFYHIWDYNGLYKAMMNGTNKYVLPKYHNISKEQFDKDVSWAYARTTKYDAKHPGSIKLENLGKIKEIASQILNPENNLRILAESYGCSQTCIRHYTNRAIELGIIAQEQYSNIANQREELSRFKVRGATA
jgi:histidinol phosphatase-like PHP family hydrolase